MLNIYVHKSSTLSDTDLAIVSLLGKSVKEPKAADVIVVAGGDGTMLNAIHQLQQYHIPFVGFNYGHVGFLLNERRPETCQEFEKYVTEAKKYELVMVKGVIEYTDGSFEEVHAFNDIYTASKNPGQLLKWHLTVNDRRVSGEFAGDGFIVSTPQGSTGYARNAGGKILKPSSKTLQYTPRCCTIGNRREIVGSFIESDETIFRFDPVDSDFRPHTVLFDGIVAQGRTSASIKSIIVSKSDRIVTLMFDNELGFYDKILNLQYHE